jgi:hypothetical protein
MYSSGLEWLPPLHRQRLWESLKKCFPSVLGTIIVEYASQESKKQYDEKQKQIRLLALKTIEEENFLTEWNRLSCALQKRERDIHFDYPVDTIVARKWVGEGGLVWQFYKVVDFATCKKHGKVWLGKECDLSANANILNTVPICLACAPKVAQLEGFRFETYTYTKEYINVFD